jgi:hypothetical protein
MHFYLSWNLISTTVTPTPPKGSYVTCTIKLHDQEHNFQYSTVKLIS